MNIGFFDSGLGGLIMLKAVSEVLPGYDYIYYGDTANLPYGDKTEEEIYALTKAGIEELFRRDCALVVVACNTASAETIRKLQDTYLAEEHPDRRILGVIVPTVQELLAANYKKAILIATKRTVESRKYEYELQKLDPSISLVSVATPELVPLIEADRISDAVLQACSVIERVAGKGDVVLLGCTHYCLLKEELREHFGDVLTIVSQDEVIPHKLADYLDRHPEIASQLHNTGKRDIVLTQHKPGYDRIIAEFLSGAYLPEDFE